MHAHLPRLALYDLHFVLGGRQLLLQLLYGHLKYNRSSAVRRIRRTICTEVGRDGAPLSCKATSRAPPALSRAAAAKPAGRAAVTHIELDWHLTQAAKHKPAAPTLSRTPSCASSLAVPVSR